VDEITVFDHQRDGRSERFAVPYSRYDLDRIAFDLHSPAPAVPLLPARQFAIDLIYINIEARRQSFDYRDERFTM